MISSSPSLAPLKVEKLLKTAGPRRYGVVTATDGLSLKIAGLTGYAALGDTVNISTGAGRTVRVKIVAMDGDVATGFAYGSLTGAAVGNVATLDRDGGDGHEQRGAAAEQPCLERRHRFDEPLGHRPERAQPRQNERHEPGGRGHAGGDGDGRTARLRSGLSRGHDRDRLAD